VSEFDNPAILSTPSLPDYNGSTPASWASASHADVFQSALEANLVDGLSNSRDVATQQAITQRNKAVKDATGQDLEDPSVDGYLPEALRRFSQESGSSVPAPDMPGMTASDFGLAAPDQARVRQLQMQVYQEQVNDLASRYPQAPIGGDIQTQAKQLANKAVSDAQATYQASGGGPLNFLAQMAGGVVSAVRDPLQVAALSVGGGEATAFKSIAGQMFETFLRQGAVNAGAQAISEPGVAAWRAERGQAMNATDVLSDLGMAAMFGGGVGALIHGASGAFAARMDRARELSARVAQGDGRAAEQLGARLEPRVAPEAAAALRSVSDDASAAAGGKLPELDDELPPHMAGPMLRDAARSMEDRNAPLMRVDAPTIEPDLPTLAPADRRAASDDARAAAMPQASSHLLGSAEAPAARELETPRAAEPAPAKAPEDGEADAQASAPAASVRERPRQGAPETMLAFLKRIGGVKDEGGDLAAMDLRKGYPGLINNARGLSLDDARRAAAEAGYLGADTDRAASESRPRDLLDAIQRHPTYSVLDDAALADREQKAQGRAWKQSLATAGANVDEHFAAAGDTANPELRQRAAELIAQSNHNISVDDAIERAAIQLESLAPGDPLGQIPLERDGRLAMVDREDIGQPDERNEYLAGLIENCIL
jgi:hypothetical protein